MPILVNLDVMMARRKIRGRDLAARIGITEQNLSLLKSGKVKGVRFETLERLCAAPALLDDPREGGGARHRRA